MSSPLYQEKSVGIKVPEEPTTQGPTEPGIPTDTQIWKASLRIVNKEFSDDLSRPSSEAFKTLEDDLTKLLNEIFQSITGFLYTKVDSFEKGSIVCKFSIFTKAESSSAEDYKTALVAASKDGKTGKFKMDEIEVKDTVTDESVGAFKGDKSKNDFQPLKVIGITIFVTAVVMVVLFLVVRAILKRRRRRGEGYSQSYDVYPLTDFDIKDAAEPTFGKMRRLEEEAEDNEERAGEETPLNKPS